ncbi:MAG TPA: 3-deoxy-D-manno-octulosonic acid transferase [Thermoanaerobaculaceae bacterium]|nr:3-deoxy-D-manno-octulosonic acid transferase [Thermoanaerobaculaceae bacterium]
MAPPSLWIYRAAIAVSLPLVAPYLLVADRRRGKRRPPLAQRLGRKLPAIPPGGVWVQAVSVGEVAVARPLLAELRRRHPGLPLVLSATTATGLAMASGVQLADVTLPFPIDLPGPVRRLMDAAQPRLVVLVETELWPELLAACGSRGIPVALANARVSDRSFRGYRSARALLRPLLAPVTVALAQDEQSARRLAVLGVPPERISTTGNVKFDAASSAAHPKVAEELRQVARGRPVLVAGSTMPGEDEVVLDAVSALAPERRPFLLLAPRHPERAPQVMQLAAARGFSVSRRTLLAETASACDVVVLDTVGELASLYQLAEVAFVGGSLVPTGGHNPIEPARFAVPVLTGPHVRNFAAVYRSFVDAGAARTVHSGAELTAALQLWLTEPGAARAAGEAGRDLLARNAGATARIADALDRFLA